ncbi:DUF4097 family beta strand repeat-containing protein [Raoultibacter phocaeensis]|uniref:DUF4097 family beta strand repeat-containing protein n=1 Tax=Raoultibacter phocaeensis TaxID=2479841 RepID=UPI0015D5828C|nr:DUF4097 family beta strand repeat-containing protein [Raoultibacter phocaeensis]
MSKAQKITLIVATALLVGGLGLSIGVLAVADFDFGNLSTTRDWVSTTNTLAPESEDAHTDIVVRDRAEDVRIEASSSDSIEIEYWESDTKAFKTTDENGVLTIEASSKPVVQFFVMDFQDRATVIKVPRSYAGSLSVETASGNVAISNLPAAGAIAVTTMSGDVDLHGFGNAVSVEAATASGNVHMREIRSETVQISTTSGTVSIDGASADSLSATSASGDVLLKDSGAKGIDVRTMSGEITASRCSGSVIVFDSTSGDIFAQIAGSESEYVIDARSISGSIAAPRGASDAEKSITLNTTSGEIELFLYERSGSETIPKDDARAETPRDSSDSTAPSAPEAPAPPEAPAAPSAPEAPAAPKTSAALRFAA